MDRSTAKFVKREGHWTSECYYKSNGENYNVNGKNYIPGKAKGKQAFREDEAERAKKAARRDKGEQRVCKPMGRHTVRVSAL